MNTLKITKSDFNEKNHYIGSTDVSDFHGNIEIDENLETVYFHSINVSGYILAKKGSGIKAGYGITASGGINAGLNITCKKELSAGEEYKIFAGICNWKKYLPLEEQTITCGELPHAKAVGLPVSQTILKHEK